MSVVSAFQGPHLRFTLVATGLFLICICFLIRRIGPYYDQLRRKWHPPSPYDPRLLGFQRNAVLFWIPFVILSGLLIVVAIYLSSYRYVGQKAEPAGTVVIQRGVLKYTDNRNQTMNIQWRGSKAAVAGIFLRFPKWTNPIGLGTYEKVITFRSSDQNKYHYQQPDEEWLSQYDADQIFLFLYKLRGKWKFPESFYVESPYFSGGKRKIFVTRSGYIVS